MRTNNNHLRVQIEIKIIYSLADWSQDNSGVREIEEFLRKNTRN